ncbi:putative methyltransferase DDB_G0268948 isoform X1 [Ixodes scapularis]|uniref:putative methyltransferase DDB_G0268948 isoform X1 n=1 Tax=Ixodes scapularis TaxID=6945 RepID=UPI001A9D9CCD|nr:putative methyltransferase DDB_G0268948 isoform X1 [Ixodes scapularis]
MSHVYRTKAHAGIYLKFRPTPPPALIEQIVSFVKEKASLRLAVDVGCGSGQSSGVLAPHFSVVHAYDMSEAQITEAEANNQMTNLTFSVASAECLPEADSSVQLVTASQSLLWFDREKFYAEAERVLVPGGVLAVYAYATPTPVAEDQDRLDKLLHDLLNMGAGAKYWGEKKTVTDNLYEGIPLPWEDHVRVNCIEDRKVQTVAHYVNYIRSWASYQVFLNEEPAEAESLIKRLTSVLMDNFSTEQSTPESTPIEVKIQFFLLMARKPLG